jgi:type IV secretion system protein VirD4
MLRAMNNSTGHRQSPRLGHIVVSRQETARPLLTPGEAMQLPPGDELVLVSGIPPIRAWKARHYEDRRLESRILPPPVLPNAGNSGSRHVTQANDWTPLPDPNPDTATADESAAGSLAAHDRANDGIHRGPALPKHEAIVSKPEPDKGIWGFVGEPNGQTICGKGNTSRASRRRPTCGTRSWRRSWHAR